MDESHVADTTVSADAHIENTSKSGEAQTMIADAPLASADPTSVEAAEVPNVAAEENGLTGEVKDTPGAVSTTATDGETAAVGNEEVVSAEAKEKPVEAVSATATQGEGAAVDVGQVSTEPAMSQAAVNMESSDAVGNEVVLNEDAKEKPVEAVSRTATEGADAVADTGEASTGPATSQAAVKIESSDQPRKRSYNDRDTRESYKKRKHRRENVKSDLTSQAPSDDPEEIRKQVCNTIMFNLTI